MRSQIIILNGTSSAGKSTLAHALRPRLPLPFCYYASDQLAEAGFRPLASTLVGEPAYWASRAQFFAGFHRSIAAFANAGNHLLVDHIVETAQWATELSALLAPFDVFWVGVHAPLAELTRREQLRGDRTLGEAQFHLPTHTFCHYDVEVDSTQPLATTIAQITSAWATWASNRQVDLQKEN
ncbi:MAG: chloramphenicol phosphotransferase CPT family protein [Janthinobacterium lividum]